MTDAFAELGLARSPWVDPAELKKRYLELAAACHPDRIDGNATPLARLNLARRTLDNPARRLRHLIDLEFPGFRPAPDPLPDWELAGKIADLSRQTTIIVEKSNRATTPLAIALLAGEKESLSSQLATTESRIKKTGCVIDEKIRFLARAESRPEPATLWELAAQSAYAEKWLAVVSECRTRLAGG